MPSVYLLKSLFVFFLSSVSSIRSQFQNAVPVLIDKYCTYFPFKVQCVGLVISLITYIQETESLFTIFCKVLGSVLQEEGRP